MTFDEFISGVQRRADLPSLDAAEAAARATFAVLGERLGGPDPTDLAEELPDELAAEVVNADLDDGNQEQPFDVEEFYRRVADRQGHAVDPDDARDQVVAVFAVLAELVTDEERAALAAELGAGYAELLP
jgi:uncharacterized protein (DUF2267 family)